MKNPVVHFEIMGPDGPALRSFYEELFGWQLREVPMTSYTDYAYLPTPEGDGIGGGVGSTEAQAGGFVTIYVEVDDVEHLVDRACRMGGATLLSPTEIPGVGVIARFRDPQGNVIGLAKSAER